MANLKTLLKAMLKDEKYAPLDYKRLRAKLKLKSDKKIIDKIIKDEQSHYRKLKKINKEKKIKWI